MLNDKVCRNAIATDKPRRIFDTGGLYLEVTPNGGKYWRLKYRFAGKEKRLALGVYPIITLAEARERRDVAKRNVAHGVDPAFLKQEAKRLGALSNEYLRVKVLS